MSAPIKSFKELLTSIARRIGMLEDDGTITTGADADISGDLTDLVNSAMRHAWQFYPWPDAKEFKEQTVIAHPTVSGAMYVPRQTATRTLATVFEAWSDDFRKKDNRACRVSYLLQSDGMYLYGSESSVWVQYRDLPPEYDDTPWAEETTYATGGLSLASDGHVYRSLQDANLNKAPATEPTWWGQVPVLACLYEPVKQGVISHWKRYQSSQPVTAKSFEDLMFDNLTHEINLIQNQEGQHLRYN